MPSGLFTGGFRSGLVVMGIIAIGIWAKVSGLLDAIIYRWEDIVLLSQEHLTLVLISGGLAIVIGVPIGILLSRPRLHRYAEMAMQLLNIGTTIPTLAVLALSMTFLGIGAIPAIFALWLASLLPIVRNTYVGIRDVPGTLIEVAAGIGMRPVQVLFWIELPNALMVIFAGIRTALAINVGTAPLAFLIGGGGLGELIFTGISLDEPTIMLAGAIPTALLAIFIDFVMNRLAVWVVPRGINPYK